MGLTGAGKSTLISQLTQQSVPIGHTLGSCKSKCFSLIKNLKGLGTATVHGYPFNRANGQTVWLIDTPGFDDTNKANARIILEIVSFLCAFCVKHKLSVGGLLYIHKITDIRMSSSSLKSLRIFEAICGKASFKDVTIVTTMWDMVQTDHDVQEAEVREAVLLERESFFGMLRSGGAGYERYQDSYTGSLKIVEHLANRERDVVLAVQSEMELDQDVTLADTTVGRYLEGDLIDTQKKYEAKIRQLEAYSRSVEGEDGDMSVEVEKQKQLVDETRLSMGFLSVTYLEMKRERSLALIEEDKAPNGSNRESFLETISKSNTGKSFHTIKPQTPATQERQNNCELVTVSQCSRSSELAPDRDETVTGRTDKDTVTTPWLNLLRAFTVIPKETERKMVHQSRRSSSLPPEAKQRDRKLNRPKRSQHSHEGKEMSDLPLVPQIQNLGMADHSMIYSGQVSVISSGTSMVTSDSYVIPKSQHASTTGTRPLPADSLTHGGYGPGVRVDPSNLRRSYTTNAIAYTGWGNYNS